VALGKYISIRWYLIIFSVGTNYSTVPFISLGEHKRHVNKRYRDDYSLEDELNKIELYRDSNRDKQILLDG